MRIETPVTLGRRKKMLQTICNFISLTKNMLDTDPPISKKNASNPLHHLIKLLSNDSSSGSVVLVAGARLTLFTSTPTYATI